ncbi:MAG: heme-binding protein [Flavobacteriales bacterium]|jgi:hypothetical protein|nr:heme-binding protein [Flavobacteriales bacterium]
MKTDPKMILALILIITSFVIKEASSQNNYIIIKKIDDIEIREYKKSINASYFDSSSKNYFRFLANYIFGGNEKKMEISMTSPVTMRLHGNKEMIFRLPDNFLFDSIPKPINSRIKIFKIASTIKASIQYSGYSNSKIEKQKTQQLIQTLNKNNIKHKNDFELNVYNPPYQILNRKNEITVTTTSTF